MTTDRIIRWSTASAVVGVTAVAATASYPLWVQAAQVFADDGQRSRMARDAGVWDSRQADTRGEGAGCRVKC
jgi:hypothetical protein